MDFTSDVDRSRLFGARSSTLGAVFDAGPMARILGADVIGAGADEAVVVELLDDVGGPSGDAADGEDRRVEIDVDSQGGVGRCGIEVDVCVELLFALYIELD